MQGCRLHAPVRCGADERKTLERLCRHVTRLAPANERMQFKAAGHVVSKLTTAWHGGITHTALSPLEFMLRSPALVPQAAPAPGPLPWGAGAKNQAARDVGACPDG